MLKKVGRALLLGAVVLSANALAGTTPKTHRLAATPDTVQWGWLDPKEPPKLTIESGDVVSIETLMHARDQIQKGTTMEKIVELRKANPGGGPHSLTGPIFVNGAKPGDVMEIRIRKIVPKRVGANFNLPGRSSPPSARSRPSSPRGTSTTSRSIRRSARRCSSRASRFPSVRSRAPSRWASTPTTRLRARVARRTPWRR
jgi:predicted RNA-binding protein with TRAM domain